MLMAVIKASVVAAFGHCLYCICMGIGKGMLERYVRARPTYAVAELLQSVKRVSGK